MDTDMEVDIKQEKEDDDNSQNMPSERIMPVRLTDGSPMQPLNDNSMDEETEKYNVNKVLDLPQLSQVITIAPLPKNEEVIDFGDNDSKQLSYYEEKRYECTKCHKVYVDSDALKGHVQLEHADVKVVLKKMHNFCSGCRIVFKNKKERFNHMKKHIGVSLSKYSCNMCQLPLGFDSLKALEAHALIHSVKKISNHNVNEQVNPLPPSQWECKVCNEKFSTRRALYDHSRMHQANDEWQCKICNNIFANLIDLENHACIHLNHKSAVMLKVKQEKDEVVQMNVKQEKVEAIQMKVKQEKDEAAQIKVKQEKDDTVQAPNLFTCKICDITFKIAMDYARHMKSHPAPKSAPGLETYLYHCHICCQVFKTEIEFERHECSSMPRLGRQHKCPAPGCNKRFHTFIGLQRHVIQHTDAKVEKCKECEKVFITEKDFQNHLKEHEGKKLFKCHICDEGPIFDTQNELTAHLGTHTAKTLYKCTTCNRMYESINQLEKHMVIKHTYNQGRKCSICNKSFDSRVELGQHMISIHTEETGHDCEVCGETFSTFALFDNHMETHKKVEEKYTVFTPNVALKKPPPVVKKPSLDQTVTVPKIAQQGRFTCPTCNKKFMYRESLKAHQLNHTEDVLYCKICFEFFKNRFDLIHHMQNQHFEAQRYKCKVCNKHFTTQGDLDNHMEDHYTSYECKFCKKKFPKEIMLQAHMAVHMTAPPKKETYYQCKECVLRFPCNNALAAHMKCHANSVKCSICNQMFLSQKSLNAHMMLHFRPVKKEQK